MFEWLKRMTQARPATKEEPEMDDVPFEVVVVHGTAAAQKLDELRHHAKEVVPVVFGDRDELDDVVETMTLNESTFEDVLARGEELDVAAWIRQKVEEDPELYQTDAKDSDTVGPVQPLTVAFDILTQKPKPEVFIGLIPVAQPWHVPAYLRPGSWNDCPDPEVHVAFFKRWFEQYGAVVTVISHDIIEFSVAKPPSTQEQALALAHEQFVYCTDLVHQGVETVNNLARTLLGTGNWYFWWD